jgi:hypothetical protein
LVGKRISQSRMRTLSQCGRDDDNEVNISNGVCDRRISRIARSAKCEGAVIVGYHSCRLGLKEEVYEGDAKTTWENGCS